MMELPVPPGAELVWSLTGRHGRPARARGGGRRRHFRRTADARNRGFTVRSPSGIGRPVARWTDADNCRTPGELSGSPQAQDGVGELGRGPTAAPWNPTARSGPAAAATVETIAAAGDKKRRDKTPGVVVKVAVAIDVQPCQ